MPTLRLVLGDQLAPDSPATRGLAPGDVVAMAEVRAEAERHPNHRQRLAFFFAAMRHRAEALRAAGATVRYQRLLDDDTAPSLPAFLRRQLAAGDADGRPFESVAVVRPGRISLEDELRDVCDDAGVPLDVRPDDHFFVTPDEFAGWLDGRKRIVMGDFYREQRRKHRVLLDGEDGPEGGKWSLDGQNQHSFGKKGPGLLPLAPTFAPDETTRAAIDDVARAYPDGRGSLDGFNWPVTPAQAEAAFERFVTERLASFGTYQDAMWLGQPSLYHALISPALNVKLLDARAVVRRVERAYRDGAVPLNAAEGFVRQVMGWREYMRGLYFAHAGRYWEGNELGATRDLPGFYWTGETGMACLADVVGQLLGTAYAHHIQRLMVAGLFAQLYGADPRQVHDWFMAYYADSVEWVTLPNVVGMSQWADGGLTATKPYVATGKYIDRMSNYCSACRYNPKEATGDDACPFTTLYWQFLHRHADRLGANPRMKLQVRNVERKAPEEVAAILERADAVVRLARDGEL